jgi:D-alanine-D-alanine ligase
MNILLLSSHQDRACPRAWGDQIVVDGVARELRALGHTARGAVAADEADVAALLQEEHFDLVFPNAYRLPSRSGPPTYLAEVLAAHQAPFIGSGYPAVKALQKSFWKTRLDAAGVPTPRWCHLADPAGDVPVADLCGPLIVKPDEGAESIGITVIPNWVAPLAGFAGGAIIEEFSRGREFTVTVLGNPPELECWPLEVVLPPGEPLLTHELKETAIRSTVEPAADQGLAQEVCELAAAAFTALELSDWARIDVVADADGRLLVIDVNLLPGLRTDDSHPSYVPLAAAIVGGRSFSSLIETLVAISWSRWEAASECLS